jgi:hypothetical protein
MAAEVKIFVRWFIAVILVLIFSASGHVLHAQGLSYNYFYRVYFKDKGSSVPSDFSPEVLLSGEPLTEE